MPTGGNEMQGKTIVITGATSGLGQAGAEKLAEMGARIVLIARDKIRAEAALERLRRSNPRETHSVYYADLSLVADTRSVAAEILTNELAIDVLINNAGAVFRRHELTAEGFEKTFATNHLSYFVLTLALLPRLKQAASARIVLTASAAHKSGRLNFDNLQGERAYRFFQAYGTSKLCNILFTRELARLLRGSSVTANCFHPGFVATNIAASEASGLLKPILRLIKSVALTPQKGAETLVYLASSPDAGQNSSGYFVGCREATPSQAAQDDFAARHLWELSTRLTGISVAPERAC
jgi:NAD(P)-dependent dehydrogenase (short-subunit alcohol dehydrogenase family)